MMAFDFIIPLDLFDRYSFQTLAIAHILSMRLKAIKEYGLTSINTALMFLISSV
jgi:hypothetical protein